MNSLGTLLWFRTGRWLEHWDCLTSAERCYRHAMDGKGDLAAEAAILLSRRLLDRDRNQDSVETTEQGLRNAPRNATLWCLLGTAQWKLAKETVAREAFEQAIAHDPNYSQAWCNLGECHLAQGNPTVALEHFDRALEFESSLVQALRNRATALSVLGRFADAQAALRATIEIRPSESELYFNVGNVLLHSAKTLATIKADIDRLIASSRYNEALANMALGVYQDNQVLEVEHKHNYLYCPIFDRQIQQLSDALVATSQPVVGQLLRDNTLIIATEIYQVGGHTRVIADIAREVHSPTVVLTDLFASYRKTPDNTDLLLDTLEHAPVIALPQGSLWDRCRALSLLTQRLQPSNILYFNHHQDPIPFVGTLGHAGSRKTLIHHCDHNPSLGSTLAGVEHVDFTQELAQTCARQLNRETRVLPLYVPDAGKRSFPALVGNAFSVVTAGAQIKFARTGELALQNIAHTVLTSVSGRYFHIGFLDNDWIAEIKAHLERNGIDPTRFETFGLVDSLWNKLASLDAHFYLGSAPLGGGRSAVEAQGCGYPVVFFRNELGSALAVDSLYASKQLGWATLAELSALLTVIGPQQARLSDEARFLYEQRFSHDEFVRVLNEIMGC